MPIIRKGLFQFKITIGIILILIAILIFVIYQFLGYKYYYKAVLSIRSTINNNIATSKKLFYGEANDSKLYYGTLAFITNSKSRTPQVAPCAEDGGWSISY